MIPRLGIPRGGGALPTPLDGGDGAMNVFSGLGSGLIVEPPTADTLLRDRNEGSSRGSCNACSNMGPGEATGLLLYDRRFGCGCMSGRRACGKGGI